MKRLLIAILAIVMVLTLVSCDPKSQPSTTPESSNSETSNDVDIDLEKLQASKDFDDFDILTIQDGVIKNDEFFIHTDYVLQNKSSESTISNITYEYVVMDSDGEIIEIDDESSQTDNYLVRLEPRNKGELQILTHVGSDEKHDEWAHHIVKYSYDMNGKRYTVDLINKLGTAEDIKDTSNVSFEEKNILAFNAAELLSYRTVCGTNNSNQTIKTLSAKIMVFDSNGLITDIEDIDYFGLGGGTIGPNEKYNLSVSDIVADEDGGHIEVSSYSYDLSVADDKGYNHFEVNLITGECIGSTNAFALDQNINIDVSELEPYIATFGKKTGEISFEIESIEEGESGGTDRITLKGVDSLFNLPGDFVLYRDYDSLLIYGFRFQPESQDENTRNYLMNALKKIFGEEFEVIKYGYKSGEYVTWEKDEYEVDLSWDYDLKFTVQIPEE